MDLDNLDDTEVQTLIDRLKHPIKEDMLNRISNEINSLFLNLDLDEKIIDTEEIEYILHVYRGRIEKDRFSIHLRFKELHHHLVRIDINPSNNTHTNPDGTTISGSHIHIYSNHYSKKDIIAIPLDKSNFPSIDNLYDAFVNFLDYNNIN